MKSVRRSTLVAAGWLCLSVAAAARADVASRDTLERFVRLAYEGRLADLAPFWAEDATGRMAFEKRTRNMVRARCVLVQAIFLEETSTGASAGSANIEVVTTREDSPALETIRLRARMTPRDDRWLISAIAFPDDELAARIASAPDEDREAIVREDGSRVTGALILALDRQVRELLWSHDTIPRASSLIAFSRDLALSIADDRGIALLTVDGAMVAQGRSDYAAAGDLARRAIDLAASVDDPDALAWIWYAGAVAYTGRDLMSEDAANAFRRAASYGERADDPVLAAGPFQMLSAIALTKGDAFDARRLAERVRAAIAASGDIRYELRFERHLALIYRHQDDLKLALHHFDRAMKLARRQDRELYPVVLADMAELLVQDGELDRASRLLEEIRATAGPEARIISVVKELGGVIAAGRDRFDDAECLLREAGALWARHGYHFGPAFDQIAPFLSKRKRHRDIIRMTLEQIPYVEERYPAAAVRALTAAAQAYQALGDRRRAIALIDEAIAIRERLNEQVSGSAEQHARSSEATAAVYELRGELAIESGEVAAALAAIERGRGRVLLEGSATAVTDAAAEEADRREESRYKQTVADLMAQTARAPGERERAALQVRMDGARNDYQSFLDAWHDRSAKRAAVVRRIDAETLAETVRRLPPAMTAVEYVVRDRRLHIFVARQVRGEARIRHFAVKVTRAILGERAGQLAHMMGTGDLRYRAAAAELFELLIAPIEHELRGAEVLCIVPDESLWCVPFAALLDERGRFLVERAAIVYAPSLTVYREIASRRPRAARAPRVLAVADPAVERAAAAELKIFYPGESFGALAGAEREGHALCAVYDACQVLDRAKATEARIKKELGTQTIVHFATHGIFDDRNPMYSRLVLRRGDDPEEDGSLEAWEIARLRLRADLVVLSACDTARGKIGGGEGVVGMVWSFFVAGARSTVATQWRIETKSAADLMIAFHGALRAAPEPLAKARALRAAQLRILGNPATRHPFYWAGFVLFGDAS